MPPQGRTIGTDGGSNLGSILDVPNHGLIVAWIDEKPALRPRPRPLFENTHLPLPKWFAAIYLATADKGGISAKRLRKMIGVTWRTAQLMLANGQLGLINPTENLESVVHGYDDYAIDV